jgi:DNA-directed RNA polymerase subunit D
MKIDLLNWDKKNNSLHFLLKGSNDAFSNLIRRYVLDEVPTLAVETVEFKDNGSALYDEIVAHRIGLIPIKTDLKSYNLTEDCTCKGEGCAKCQLQITLKSSKKGFVTAGEAESEDPKCAFVQGDMPITKLTGKQKIELTATAILGRGKDHMKWSPGLAFYKVEPKISFSGKLTDEQQSRVHAACGDTVSSDSKAKVDTDKLYTSSRFDACLGVLEEAGATVEDTDNYIFTVESWGQLDCKEMLERAADAIVDRLDAIEQQLN